MLEGWRRLAGHRDIWWRTMEQAVAALKKNKKKKKNFSAVRTVISQALFCRSQLYTQIPTNVFQCHEADVSNI
jgi:hypothetical protein